MARNNGFDAIRDALANDDHQFNLNVKKAKISYYKSLKYVLRNKVFYQYIAGKLIPILPILSL
jgi:hypothetical protein